MAGQKGIKAGKAYVEIYADNSRLSRGLRAASAKLKAFGASVTAIGLKMAAIGTAAIVPLLGASKVFANMGDNILPGNNTNAVFYPTFCRQSDKGSPHCCRRG